MRDGCGQIGIRGGRRERHGQKEADRRAGGEQPAQSQGCHYDRGVTDHESFMRLALDQARLGEAAGEVPIGAVVVIDGQVVASAFNRPIGAVDPTAHAEILALRQAAAAIGNYRLTGATLYVTLEPCLMCVGALVHARVERVVFGAREPKTGALESTMRALDTPALNHRFDVVDGVLEEECRGIVRAFFKTRRDQQRAEA
jgi:tRNA(adenine34) deaminase